VAAPQAVLTAFDWTSSGKVATLITHFAFDLFWWNPCDTLTLICAMASASTNEANGCQLAQDIINMKIEKNQCSCGSASASEAMMHKCR